MASLLLDQAVNQPRKWIGIFLDRGIVLIRLIEHLFPRC